MLIATITAAVEHSLLVGLVSFCNDVDANSLKYIQHFASESVYNTTKYYITGDGVNLLMELNSEMDELLSSSSAMINGSASQVEQECNSTEMVQLRRQLDQMQSLIG